MSRDRSWGQHWKKERKSKKLIEAWRELIVSDSGVRAGQAFVEVGLKEKLKEGSARFRTSCRLCLRA